MQESSVYEHLLQTTGEERYQRGAPTGNRIGVLGKTRLNLSLECLSFGLMPAQFAHISPALETIHELQRLEFLFQEALRAETFEAFARTLDMSGN